MTRQIEDHPRLRGEQKAYRRMQAEGAGSPPLARGTDAARGHLCAAAGITPACAGNSLLWPRTCRPWRDHPRLRGEQDIRRSKIDGWRGSPPLARGTVHVDFLESLQIGITPACAGNRRQVYHQSPQCWDHPRLRGEQCRPYRQCAEPWGSPPLARGTADARRT